MGDILHKFTRAHIKALSQLDDGMPTDRPFYQVNLSENANHFLPTEYKFYPSRDNPRLYSLYIEFLKKLEKSKEGAISESDLDFLSSQHMLFSSSASAIDLIIQTFCEPNQDDRICIANPTFPLYKFCAVKNNVKVIDVPLQGKNFDRLNISEIKANKAKIIFIPNPNNPVGTLIYERDIQELLDYQEGIFVVDEAYIAFSRSLSFVKYIVSHPNLIILRSFSKSWGLSGIRSGVILADPKIIASIETIQLPNSFPMHTQDLLLEELINFDKVIRSRYLIAGEIEKLSKALSQFSFVDSVYPSETNFVLIKFKDHQFVYDQLLAAGILVKNTNHIVGNTLRISLGDSNAKNLLLDFFYGLEKNLAKRDKV